MPEKIPRGQCTANVKVSNEGVDVAVSGFQLPENAKASLAALFGEQAVFVDLDAGHFGFVLDRNQDWQAEARAQLRALLRIFASGSGATDLKVYYRISFAYEDDEVVFA